MSQQLVLEALYPEMEEATIGQWQVAVGDQVVPGTIDRRIDYR